MPGTRCLLLEAAAAQLAAALRAVARVSAVWPPCKPAHARLERALLPSVHCCPCAQAFSASSALAGCAALRNMLSHAETQQLQALRADMQALQDSGVAFPHDSWPAKLLRPEPRRALRPAAAALRQTDLRCRGPVCAAESASCG